MLCCYLVDLYYVVECDRYMFRIYVVIVGGFVLVVLLVILVYGFGLYGWIFGFVLLVVMVLMFVGVLFVVCCCFDLLLWLLKGFWMCLLKSLLVFVVSFFFVILLVVGILLEGFGGWFFVGFFVIGVVWGVFELFFGMIWGGLMKYVFVGVLYLVWYCCVECFGGGCFIGFKVFDLVDLQVLLGVEKFSDFIWNQLFGFDVCVQCGKCEVMCLVFVVGQLLNLKKLIQDMVIGLVGGNDVKFVGSFYLGKLLGEYGGGLYQLIVVLDGKVLVDVDILWFCIICWVCVEECLMMIEYVDVIVDMCCYLILEKGVMLNKGVEVLDNLIVIDNFGGFVFGGWLNWVVDLNLLLMSEKKSVDVLFWVGDGVFDMCNQCILCVFVKIFKVVVVDFVVFGLEECDSGDVVCWLGDEVIFQNLVRCNIVILVKYCFICIVSCDLYSFYVLKNEYGVFGGDYQVLYYSIFIDELLCVGML